MGVHLRQRGDRSAVQPVRGFDAVERAARALRMDVQTEVQRVVLSPKEAAEHLKADLRERGVLRDDA